MGPVSPKKIKVFLNLVSFAHLDSQILSCFPYGFKFDTLKHEQLSIDLKALERIKGPEDACSEFHYKVQGGEGVGKGI